ncbi:MAG: HPP family protein [Bermanella sp.]
MNKLINECIKTLGIESNTTSHSEKCLSALGAFISMMCCYGITQYSLSPDDSQLFIASMAASAVLLFAVPHGALSQPWPLVMGHIVSGVIGVACYQTLGDSITSVSLAVSLSIIIMYYLGCLHPPGAATAFFVVTAGEDVHALGFDFIWLIIMTNVLCLLITAILFNGFFHWRRYPAHFFKLSSARPFNMANPAFSQDDVAAALHQVNSFIDITPDDLTSIFEHALQHAQQNQQTIKTIEAGKFYSNGLLGRDWQVFEVLSCDKSKVQTCIVAGKGNQSELRIWRLKEFKRAVQQEVKSQGQHWLRPSNTIENV